MRYILSVAVLEIILSGCALSTSLCGDDSWVAFKDTKCFKLLDELVTKEEAHGNCSMEAESYDPLNSPLLTIQSYDEQYFVENYIFNNSLTMDNVWLGARRQYGRKFTWDDGSRVEFSNWAGGAPTIDPDEHCVELAPKKQINDTETEDEFEIDGLWNVASCEKKNIAVCQKLQTWSSTEMQKAILQLRNEIKTTNVNVQNSLMSTNNLVEKLRGNPVPVGFIYVQLYGQSSPVSLWPGLGWSDISSSYAGLFFRVVGGNSESFGTIQSDNSPRITGASSRQTHNTVRETTVPVGGTSGGWLYTGDTSGNPVGIDLTQSGGEVRPRNQAMKLWKRTY